MADEAVTEVGVEKIDVPVVDLATIVAKVVGRVLPAMVETEVRREMEQRTDAIANIVDTVAEMVEVGAFDDVREMVVGLYARHLARVAIEAGVGVGEYAKMARDAKKGEGS